MVEMEERPPVRMEGEGAETSGLTNLTEGQSNVSVEVRGGFQSKLHGRSVSLDISWTGEEQIWRCGAEKHRIALPRTSIRISGSRCVPSVRQLSAAASSCPLIWAVMCGI